MIKECVFESATTDYVFKVNMSTSGAPFRKLPGIISHIMFPLNGKFRIGVNSAYNVYTKSTL